MSASKYMTSIKMREAKRLIGMKKFSLKEIASMLKFSSPTYFGYAYEAFYGHPPSADLRK
jgi:AraC-like DNA-binding protein